MYRTDDPAADFDRYDREQTEYEKKLPHCDICGTAISEHYYNINGDIYCEECLNDNFRCSAEDYEAYDGYED